MRLLLTNDDGIAGDGLAVLADELSVEHEVWILAPDSNRSAVSHGITMDAELTITKKRERVYMCSGTPVDCVVAALRGALGSIPFDAVLSGINRGPNIGTDVIYSGTAAAARQAVLYGLPGIALSICRSKDSGDWDYSGMAQFVRRNLKSLIDLCSVFPEGRSCGRSVFVNVNAQGLRKYSGVKTTVLSNREYRDKVEVAQKTEDILASTFNGGDIRTYGEACCDYTAVEDGCISVTRVVADPVTADRPEGVPFTL